MEKQRSLDYNLKKGILYGLLATEVNKNYHKFTILFLHLFLLLPFTQACNPFVKQINEVSGSRLDSIEMPEGFKIGLYVEDVKNARSMTLGDKGTVFVGSRSAGNVYALRDNNRDYKADEVLIIADGLNSPNGVAFKDGDLYVAEISRIIKFENIENNLTSPPDPIVINDDFPDKRQHGWKYIAFGPDNKLYVPVGAPCNNCLRDEGIYASITRMDPDGSNLEIYASGIRNTVGFDWHPETDVLWFTDNGRDWMGDNRPPDELNRAPEKGLHFGYPFCHGDIPDTKFGNRRSCDEFISPVQNLGPHVAALGMIFYTGNMFPPEYKNQVFIAEHGSWNRTTPIGYRVTMVKLDGNKALSYTPFASGWLQDGKAWGRPVDILQLEDGSILVSDDSAGVVYRISWQ